MVKNRERKKYEKRLRGPVKPLILPSPQRGVAHKKGDDGVGKTLRGGVAGFDYTGHS